MPRVRDSEGQYTKGTENWEVLLQYDCVKRWLSRYPDSSQDVYGRALLGFCEHYETTPDEVLKLDPKTARDMVMDYCYNLRDYKNGVKWQNSPKRE
jgi:hypothetical protein